MAQLNDLIVTGKSRFLNEIHGQIDWSNVLSKPATYAPTIGTTATTAMAGNTNVNNVTQTATTTSANYEILFSGTADNTTRAEGVRKSGGITFNPSDVKLKVGSSESNTMITGLSVSVSGILHGGCNVTMTGDDITLASSGNTQTWDGTNTSLVTAVTSAKGTVTQTNTAVSSAASYYNILFSNAAADTTTRTDSVRKSAYLFFDTKDSTLTTGNLVASSTVYAADVSNLTSTWDGTNTSLKTAIGNKISDIKLIKVNIPCTSLTKNMSLATYVTSSLPSGYTFIGWQSCGCTNGWVSTFPFYLANVLSSTGSPWWEGALNTNTGCGVDFYYFAIKK